MQILENISLQRYNTFGIPVVAPRFVSITNVDDLQKALQLPAPDGFLILGGGSNILFTQNPKALVLHINISGISIVYEDEDKVHLQVMAGENWHQLVLFALQNQYGGIENLSLIPGNAGTAPIQNIGAYGVEIKDVLVRCQALSIQRGELVEFSNSECELGYRTSIFKTREKGNYIITSITLELTKRNHRLKTSYGAIQQHLEQLGVADRPTIQQISESVIAIRRSKLPDPQELGNGGSFFKNPEVDQVQFEKFISRHPEAPHFKVGINRYKIPAGWLIEQCGFKGKRMGDAGVHNQQALVLVNYGNATGSEIVALAEKIQQEVVNKFGILIEPEVNIL